MDDYINRQRSGYDAEADLIPAATLTTTTTGAAHDIGENALLEIVSQVRGTVSGTSPTMDVTIEEDDNAAFSSATVILTMNQQTAAGQLRGVVRTTQRYVRAVATLGGTSPSFGDAEVFIAS